MDSLSSGIVEFERNWPAGEGPRLRLGDHAPALSSVQVAPGRVAGRVDGYFSPGPGALTFVLPLPKPRPGEAARERVYLAGDFNGWQEAVGRGPWELEEADLDGETVLQWTGPAEGFLSPAPARFKFVTGENIWLSLPNAAPNVVRDERGNANRVVDPQRTGAHLWRFTVERPFDLAEPWSVALEGGAPVRLGPGDFFFELGTDLPLGALTEEHRTLFRLFAPRARAVTLHLRIASGAEETAALARRADEHGVAGVWETTLARNLHGAFYWYTLDGVREGPGRFDPGAAVLDPYALATLDRGGPGIVLDRAWIGGGDRDFQAPPWHELIIAEAHVRDLAALAPIVATPEERLGFSGLAKWIDSPDFYLHQLGINCVELQPVQEFDNATRQEYHWGYMTDNYFAPESSYSLAPAAASGVRELQEVVRAFHRRGMAVLLDVVYNHVGEPPHLRLIDRLYYFEQDSDGRLTNWSGCGNDLRASAAMAKRLIIDSCTHLIEAYGVDGFRFDLAELLGVEVLSEVEAALKRVHPDVILIAEPWSFRGHIAGALRDTGWASWNDGYRDFVRAYVLGRGPGERLEYFLRGSPWYFAKWPAQTVNYTESHDDRAWIDLITERPGGDGFVPTENDRRRTRLMAALLFLSVGIPMLSSGQDFLRSKRGVTNTYQRGDLNALDYGRLQRYRSTHAYFAEWIEFRRGPYGKLLCHYSRPSEGFFQFFRGTAAEPLAMLVNADQSIGPDRLLFAVNPLVQDVAIPVGAAVAGLGAWVLLADHDRFYPRALPGGLPSDGAVGLPGLGCSLWLCAG
jgi:pullulanase/glycogen debranching enzyme